MNPPAAVLKAESLARFAKHCGAPRSEFDLALTLEEAFALLDYMATGALGRYTNQEEFERDIAKAKVNGNPFEILDGTLFGFRIVKAMDLH
jgi:hypothetical protein